MHSLSRASSVMHQRWMTSIKLMRNKEVLYRRPTHCTILIHAFIMSKLDYYNSLLSGLREDHITKFQLMQILPHARLLTGTRKHVHEHISPILRSLHWLPIPEIIDFKSKNKRFLFKRAFQL